MNKTKFIAVLFVFFCQQQLVAQKQLTLEDIYKNNLYGGRGVGQLRWMKDNKGYSTLEYNAIQKGMDIMLYDVESDAKKVLISASQLTPKGANKSLSVADYSWSDDNSKVLIFTNTRKVWRQNSRGDYWVLNLSNNKLTQVGKGLEEATLMFAKFSPKCPSFLTFSSKV